MKLSELLERKEKMAQGQIEFDVNEYNELLKQIAQAEAQQEQQEQEQKQSEQLNSIMGAIVDMDLYGSIVPSPEEGERLYEYEANKQAFNQILYTFVEEQTQGLTDYFKQLIEDKNAKIADLSQELEGAKRSGEEVIKALGAARSQISMLEQDLTEARGQIIELEKEIYVRSQQSDEYVIEIAKAHQEADTYKEQVNELEARLKAAQKPVAPVSGNLKSMINELAANNKIKSSLEIALENSAPFRGKVEKKGAQDAESFRNEADNNDPQLVHQDAINFPEVQEAQSRGILMDQGNTGGEVEAQKYVTRAEFERLELEVNKLKAQALFK